MKKHVTLFTLSILSFLLLTSCVNSTIPNSSEAVQSSSSEQSLSVEQSLPTETLKDIFTDSEIAAAEKRISGNIDGQMFTLGGYENFTHLFPPYIQEHPDTIEQLFAMSTFESYYGYDIENDKPYPADFIPTKTPIYPEPRLYPVAYFQEYLEKTYNISINQEDIFPSMRWEEDANYINFDTGFGRELGDFAEISDVVINSDGSGTCVASVGTSEIDVDPSVISAVYNVTFQLVRGEYNIYTQLKTAEKIM